MTPCWLGLHRWSHWGDCFSAGDGRVMQARYCLRCRCADTRTVAQAKPVSGVEGKS
jgi:hypothetical protein